jgi:hypothetical protein
MLVPKVAKTAIHLKLISICKKINKNEKYIIFNLCIIYTYFVFVLYCLII